MKYVVVFMMMLSLSFGLVTESFRYQSTAGLFEDDYDLLFDPARIPEIQGSRLWTSLANFVSGDEQLFSDGSQPFFIIGGVTGLGGYYPGLMYDRRADKTGMATGLYDPNGIPLYGDGEVTTINWNNPDTLGNFTDRTVETRSASAYEAINSSDWYIAAGTRVRKDVRLGLGFMHSDYALKTTAPTDNFGYYYATEDLVGDTLAYLMTADFAGDRTGKTSENDFIFSAWLDRENVAFGFNVRFAMLNSANEALILGDSAEYDLPQNPDTSFTLISVLDSVEQPRSGNRLNIGLKSFYSYNENAQGRFYVDLYMLSRSYSDDAIDYFLRTSEEIYNDNTYDTLNTITYYDGKQSSKGLRAGTKHLFNLSPRLKFGIGIFFDMQSYNDSTTSTDTTVSIRVYDNGDTIPNFADYTRTITQSETWMTTVEGSTSSFTIPVGLEFAIAKPLAFRIGAQHTISYNDYTTTVEMIDYQPTHTLTVRGDGSQTEIIEDPGPRPERSVEQETETVPRTSYFYGLGWNVTNNLQIDFMGFNDLTDLSNWRLSATLKFD